MPDDITLHIDGQIYGGWKEINVRRSLDVAADTFGLTLTDRWAEDMARRPIVPGAPCQVFLGKEKLITGYVDDVEPEYDARSYSVRVAGRSKVGDLVDCSYPADGPIQTQYRNRTLTEIARIMAKPLGVDVVDEVGLTERRTFAREQGETVFEFLSKVARTFAVRLISDADGRLVISRSGATKVSTALVLGENVYSASGQFSTRDRFSHYYHVGQRPGDDDTHGEAAAHVVGRSEDLRVRYRPTVVVSETDVSPAEAARRARWQRNVAYGRSRQITYTVAGWRHADGLWRPNHLVRVEDARMGISGKGEESWLMIASVRFVMDSRGRRTELVVMPREAFDLIELPDDDAVRTWDSYAAS